jgi:ABC-2 type transport system permease protein
VLFFGVDETLDPAVFALLPLPPRTLASGMLAAACAGIPGVATAVALCGLVVGGGLRAGPAGGLVALLGAGLSLLLCVVASRAITSGFAELLRSRRVRDLTAVLLALIAASLGPLQLVITSLASHATLGPVLATARVLGWTPLSAGFVAPYDLVDGRPWLAVARLCIVAVSVAGLLWWWSRTLESAMVGGSSSGVAGAGPAAGGAIRTLVPRLLPVGRADAFLAILARELRYWSRDPRRRSALISITIGGAVMPVALRVAEPAPHAGGLGLPLAVAFSALIAGVLGANQFGFDGTAYSMHVLAGVRGRTELWARDCAVALLLGPVLVVIIVVVALLSHDAGSIGPALGAAAGTFGVSLGVSSVMSVLAAYPVPEGRNAFSVSTGTGGAKGMLVLVGMIVSVILAAPVMIAAGLLPDGLLVLLLPLGLAWGAAGVVLGAYIAGDLLDRRGPELLLAVSPRR